MKLGYRFYRNNFIKAAILSVVCLYIIWEWYRGQVKAEPGAILLLAVFIFVGNSFLFFMMRQAKRREEAETLQALNQLSRGSPSGASSQMGFDEAARKRRKSRKIVALFTIGVGVLGLIFGRSYLLDGIPVPWVAGLFIALGILAILGVNVFYGGPLDMRLDRFGDQPKTGR